MNLGCTHNNFQVLNQCDFLTQLSVLPKMKSAVVTIPVREG